MSDQDVEKIDAWLKATGTAESRLGLLAAANSRAIERIRGGTATMKTFRAVMAYIEANPVTRSCGR